MSEKSFAITLVSLCFVVIGVISLNLIGVFNETGEKISLIIAIGAIVSITVVLFLDVRRAEKGFADLKEPRKNNTKEGGGK